VKRLGLWFSFMVEDVSFESAAYSEGETKRFSFEGDGTTVLAFFPGAFTGVCTEEMCEFRDSMSEFKDLDAEVIGVSVDTPFALEEFAEQNDLNFTLVSDTGKEVSEQYGVKAEMPELGYEIATRATFIVHDGEVVYSEILEDTSELPDFQTLKEQLEKL
jgi:peroxiredoxin